MRNPITAITIAFVFCGQLACSPSDFSFNPPAASNAKLQEPSFLPFTMQETFILKPLQDSFSQPNYQRNKISLSVRVSDSLGSSVRGLQEQNFELQENDQPIEKFRLNSSDVNQGTRADVVFVMDHTSSMDSTINTVKSKVRDFVAEMAKRKIQANLCLVTFKDETSKKCLSFVEDDPATEPNENLISFLDELSRLKSGGGWDEDENQLRALMDAAEQTPWHPGAQRLAILLTDSNFHYSPGNAGQSGSLAPKYEDAIGAIRAAQMLVFAVAPNAAGYSQPFKGQVALPNAVAGGFFDFSSLLNGATKMNEIFNAIVEQIATNYTLEYFVDENPRLAPDLSFDLRQISVAVKHSTKLSLRILSSTSSLPAGHPEYRKKWRLSRSKKDLNGLFRVSVDGAQISSGVKVSRTEVEFEQAPAAGQKIQVEYDPENILDGIKFHAFALPKEIDLETLAISLNGEALSLDQMRLSVDLEGYFVFEPAAVTGSASDLYQIYEKRGLDIRISGSQRQ